MLSNRYFNDNKSCLKLNPVQKDQKARIQKYFDAGKYRFKEVPCLICGGRNFETLSEKDRYGLYMPVAICRDCGLVQATPRMTEESYHHFYNDGHRRLYVGKEKPDEAYFQGRYREGKRTVEFLSEHIEIKGKRILEVGCGSGAILKYLYDSRGDVKGIDLSREYLEYGKERYGLDLSVTDVFDLPDRHKFDLIIYSDVLEHILDPVAHLDKIKRLLKEEGLLYIKVPGIKNLYRPYLADFLKSIQNAHVYYYSLTTLRNLMECVAGFRMVYADEEVRSLWKVSSNPPSVASCIKNDYADCMAYLKHLEKRRVLRRVLPFAAWSLAEIKKFLSR